MMDRRSQRNGVRPEIQALRAAAVLLVVVSHLWPGVLPGGYIGVDVFFVISGYLITALLLREIDRTGRLSLTAFWARRARRILPAALVTLLFCALATILFVPIVYWEQFLAELRASTTYVQNWHLAERAVDYFAADDAPSPVQHFWSLSTEEQFYVVWPVLLILAMTVTRRRPARTRRHAIAFVIVLLTAVSLAYSLFGTAANPAQAYFITPTRAWEFGAGGMLALLPALDRSHEALRAAVAWLGIAAIAGAAVLFSTDTPFPGVAALLPVLGALAIMGAGAPVRRWAATPALSARPVQFVGDISYSLYLWHWPLIVFAPFVVGHRVDTPTALVVLALTVLAAWGSKVLIEDPVRKGEFFTAHMLRGTFAPAAAATAVVMGVALLAAAHVDGEVEAAAAASARVLAERPPCFGAAARDAERPCRNDALRLTVVPTPIEARRPGPPCRLAFRLAGKQVCEFGVPRAEARATVALVGDSHASHWRPALDELARARRWHGIHLGHHGCPLSAATRDLEEPERSSCLRWKRAVHAWFRAHPEVRTVFASHLTGGTGVVAAAGRTQAETKAAGLAGAWAALPASVRRIVVIRDTPKVRGNTDTCVQEASAERRRADLACAVTRSRALEPDPAVAAARLSPERVRVVDLTRFFCDRRLCFPVVGGVLVFEDPTHITHLFARTLAPILGRATDAAIGRKGVARTAQAGTPRCFGAPSRDWLRPCRNPRLRLMVRPTPQQAKRPFGRCRLAFRLVDKQVCSFGVAQARAATTVALIGDSHAGHLRPALDAVAKARRWHGLNIGHASCPLSMATRDLVEPNRSHCRRWKRGLLAWFKRHPEVTTVFVSQLSGGSGVAPQGGHSAFETAVRGYAAAWRALPRSVTRIVVLRDTPKVRGFTDTCVEQAMRARRPAGTACAVARRTAVDPDPAFVAARRSRSARVQAIDLTRIFCDRRRCYPVIGGALAFKDPTHLSGVFATTLGPVLLRRVRG